MKQVILSLFLLLPGVAAADEFQNCLQDLRPEAESKHVSAATFDAAVQSLQPDMKVLDNLDAQPEFKIPVWDYLAGLVDDERVRDGKEMMHKWAGILNRAQRRFGVSKYVVTAVWGVESDYGRAMGKRPLVQSLATLACFGRRQAYFRSEFIALLRILDQGDMEPAQLTGSWAGAFGQTQFMPSTFLRMAVDMEGKGRKDIVASVPDALGSTANYLHKSGWNPHLPWGFEVILPKKYHGPDGRSHKHSMTFWKHKGLRRADHRPLGKGMAGLLLPAGSDGPAFLVTKNFDAIYSYNASESYALAIAHLSDRLRGGGGFVTPWPTDDPGLSRAQRKELQILLSRAGYDVGNPDGTIGAKTRQAVADFQSKNGMEVTGHPGMLVLRALRD